MLIKIFIVMYMCMYLFLRPASFVQYNTTHSIHLIIKYDFIFWQRANRGEKIIVEFYTRGNNVPYQIYNCLYLISYTFLLLFDYLICI